MSVNVSAIICDDIRQEITGKLFLIGAYVHNMGVPSFPAESTFDCLIRFSGLSDDAEKMTLTIRHVGYKPEESTYNFPHVRDGCTTVAIFGFPIKAKSAGAFFLEVAVDGGRRRKIERLFIEEGSGVELHDQALS